MNNTAVMGGGQGIDYLPGNMDQLLGIELTVAQILVDIHAVGEWYYDKRLSGRRFFDFKNGADIDVLLLGGCLCFVRR